MNIDFLVPGFSKCGTTTLCSLLQDHPDVYIPKMKEPGFLAKADFAKHGQDLYESFFTDSTREAILGEGSSWYTNIEFEEVSRQNIVKHFPDVKLIFLARDPVMRIESSFREYHHSGGKFDIECPFDLEEALRCYPNIINDTLYWSRIQNYLPYFSERQILVLFLENLVSNPVRELVRCFEFLGIDSTIRIPNASRRLNSRSTKFFDSEPLR